ncbi:Dna2/Cas4 domain-containing protein [Clostridium sporogenes]|uniref:AAA family ATPase n=1 Tax=Clostridium sporogenes TaxID=1509 RepID=UPI0013D17CC4|nr:AAA family ATPase [Clostridium sporogenes]MDU5011886.1 AAA family ATPase [Clostridium botulinum]MDU5117087.1 AAA family ATPase [Clostridium botulinum]NFG96000.1 Dna2/Cas4 domain-containing protein [Clostridium sporogenes]
MQYSHSRVESFKSCPYKYKLRYIDKLKTIPKQDANNALICGNTIHLGAEKDLKAALKFYKSNYYVLTDLHINEIIKFEYLIPKLKELLLDINIYSQEYLINTKRFKGIVDLIVKNDDGTVDVFDFKYSNAIEHYMESPQLHIYKYFMEQKGFKVRKLGFIFIPKISIRQKKEEDLYKFRKRLLQELKASEIQIAEVLYNPNKVIEFMDSIIDTTEVKEYKKNPTNLCSWCEYEEYCLKEIDYMLLPKNERRERKIDTNPDLWIYADSYVGKSTFIDQYDDLLFLNTDGNTDNTTSPVIRIMDKVWWEGRIQKKKFAWEFFIETVEELEKKDNDFKRICIDLVEDLYEHCRLYTYDKLGVEHEQDAGFGKGWDMVRTEYLSAIKRLKNLGYQIIYISKEVVKEINLKNGAKLTAINPNINDKVANVLAGTVDLTVRAFVKDEDRFLQLEKKENVFGGGRFNFKVKKIPLDMKEFIKALEEAQEGVKTYSKMAEEEQEPNKEEKPTRRRSKKEETKVEDKKKEEVKETTLEEVNEPKEEPTEEPKEDKPIEETKGEKPKRRRRRKADEE